MYLYFKGQGIHLSVFSENTPKNADLFFLSKNGRGEEYFFLSVLDRPKTNI